MKVEELLAEEDEKNARSVDLWKQADADFVLPEIEEKAEEEEKPGVVVRMRVEVVSAVGFEADDLYCEYQILLPLGWTCLSETGNWHLTEQGEFTCFGSTQIAMVKDMPKSSTGSAGVGTRRSLLNAEPITATAVAPIALFLGLLALLLGMLLGAEYMLWVWAALFVS